MAGNETADRHGQYPRLSGRQLATVAAYAERRPTRRGEVLYDQGEEGYDFVVVLDGWVAVVGGYGGEQHLVGVHGPGRFLGELGLLSGQGAVLAAVVLERGEVLVVPPERVRELFSRHPTLGDLVLRSYLLRRGLAIEDGARMGIVGSRSLTDTRRLRGFAARNRLRQRWIDPDDRRAQAPLRELGVAPQQTLVLLWRGQQGPGNPSNTELARMIALLVPSSGETVCDLVLVGVGTGELVAVVDAASDGLAAVALAAISPELLPGCLYWIEGYPGFPAGISEAELAERAAVQAGTLAAQEAQLLAEGPVTGQGGGGGVVTLADGRAIAARPVAGGAGAARLAAPRLGDFEGTGIHYAPPLMDARLWAGQRQRSASRQFGRTSVSDVVLFPTRGAVPR
ncbi:MAG TPA: cyclic nucleotide-binding domain-containing protein [Actinomycetes bacterium]|nr:cyclic nucleotide-binding domain-containing protein [Actinomycetes bacterium]